MQKFKRRRRLSSRSRAHRDVLACLLAWPCRLLGSQVRHVVEVAIVRLDAVLRLDRHHRLGRGADLRPQNK